MKRSKFRDTSAPLVVAVALVAASLASSVASASVSLGAPGDRTICPDPTFNACYIGVDGSRVAVVDANSSSSFSFVGLGVQSSEISNVAFPPATGATSTMPNGNLTVQSGASLSTGTRADANPYNTGIVVGNGNNSTGTLFVDGGQVTTPVLAIGQYDTTGGRASTGTVTLADNNAASGNAVSRITVTFDSSASGSLPGFTAIQIGRGLGSTGDLALGYGASVTATAGSVSIGRNGTGTLEVGDSATFASAGSIYGSAGDPSGTTRISVNGTITTGVGANILLGIAATGSGLNQGFLKETDAGGSAHGNATLTLVNGTVNSNVVIGTGGTLDGNGTINGSVQDYGGTVSPGFSPGKITIADDFVMDGGTYLVQIAGTGPGMTDFLDIGGNATLTNATILFSFIDGFAPDAGFTFDFLHAAGGVAASNLTFVEEGLMPGFTFDTSIDPSGAFSFRALSDGVAAVPEPAPFALLAIGLVGIALARRRPPRRVGTPLRSSSPLSPRS